MTLPSWDSLPIRTKRSRKRLYGVIANEYSLTAWKALPHNVKRSKKHLYNYIANAKNLEEYDELAKNNMRSTRLLYTYIKENASGSKPTLTITVKSGESNVSGASVTIGSTTKSTGNDGKTTFTLDYDNYLVEVEKSGYYDYSENIKFRANHKSFTLNIEAEPATTGTVTVTCQPDSIATGRVVLSTHNTFDWEDMQTEFEYTIAYGDFASPSTSCTLYTLDGQGQPVGTSIPFGSYYLYAKGTKNGETVQYDGTLTVDGNEEVTITLTEAEGGK